MSEKKNDVIPLSGRNEKSPRPEVTGPISSRLNNNDETKQQSPRAAGATARGGIVSARGDKEPQVSARDEPILTNRSVMDTARVHTALAALSAERSVLISKLQYIDSALESEKKKKNSRSIRK
jgi:hypothetical protein